jgi:hypothetical protein
MFHRFPARVSLRGMRLFLCCVAGHVWPYGRAHGSRRSLLFIGVSRANRIIHVYAASDRTVPPVIYHFAYNCPIQVCGKLNYAHAMYQRHGANIYNPRLCRPACMYTSYCTPCACSVRWGSVPYTRASRYYYYYYYSRTIFYIIIHYIHNIIIYCI